MSLSSHSFARVAQRRQQVAHLQHLAANGTPQERARAQEVLAQMQSAQALQQQQQQVSWTADPLSWQAGPQENACRPNVQHLVGVLGSDCQQ